MLRFILTAKENREFVAQRYCFRGSIDDWIDILDEYRNMQKGKITD